LSITSVSHGCFKQVTHEWTQHHKSVDMKSKTWIFKYMYKSSLILVLNQINFRTPPSLPLSRQCRHRSQPRKLPLDTLPLVLLTPRLLSTVLTGLPVFKFDVRDTPALGSHSTSWWPCQLSMQHKLVESRKMTLLCYTPFT